MLGSVVYDKNQGPNFFCHKQTKIKHFLWVCSLLPRRLKIYLSLQFRSSLTKAFGKNKSSGNLSNGCHDQGNSLKGIVNKTISWFQGCILCLHMFSSYVLSFYPPKSCLRILISYLESYKFPVDVFCSIPNLSFAWTYHSDLDCQKRFKN